MNKQKQKKNKKTKQNNCSRVYSIRGWIDGDQSCIFLHLYYSTNAVALIVGAKNNNLLCHGTILPWPRARHTHSITPQLTMCAVVISFSIDRNNQNKVLESIPIVLLTLFIYSLK